jgi:hypothetical protein
MLDILPNGIIHEISTRIPQGIWKSFILTCRAFYTHNNRAEIAARANHLLTLLTMFPDKPWNWCGLSRNPNITFQGVLDNPDKPWYWYWLSKNPNITPQGVIDDNPDKSWDWCELSQNSNITLQLVLDNPDIQCDWG